MTFVKHHKHHLGAFVILIIIATVSGYFAFKTNITQNTRLPEPSAQADPPATQSLLLRAGGGQAVNKTQTVDVAIQDTSDKIQINNKTQNTTNKTQITKDTKADSTTTSYITVDSQQFNNAVTLRIGDKEYKHLIATTTVYDLMAELKSENKLSFSGKEYSGMGFFVDEINDVKNDNLAGKYWIYYINGQSAQVGISNYIIKPDDLIEWKYENTNL